MLQDARTYPRFVGGLRRFLRDPMTVDDCRRVVRETVAGREQSFLHVLEQAVYANPRSPYRALLGHAGAELEDVARLVDSEGLEGALDRLHDVGVHLALDELRGRVPVRRGSLELHFTFADLANPLVAGVFSGRSGGSRSLGRISLVSFDSFAHYAAYWGVFLSAFDLWRRPSAIWYPPVMPGISLALAEAKVGRKPDWWKLPSPLMRAGFRSEGVLVATAWALGRAARRPTPLPRHLPPAAAGEVAAWLAARRREGRPGMLAATPSSAIRVCRVAAERGLEISGSFFRMGGEPYTAAKRKIVHDAGAAGACNYLLGELGWIGIACADAAAPDDVHVGTDRLSVRSVERALPTGERAGMLSLTSLHPSLRTIFLNVETDDFGVLEERECGCRVGALGLPLHLHTIRSVEKLTGEGVSLAAETLLGLVEEFLPGRFGGTAADYQLVEREREGVTRVEVVVSDRVGALDPAAVVEGVLEFLEQAGRVDRAMAASWRVAGTLDVVRAEPHVTRASKVLPLHLARPR